MRSYGSQALHYTGRQPPRHTPHHAQKFLGRRYAGVPEYRNRPPNCLLGSQVHFRKPGCPTPNNLAAKMMGARPHHHHLRASTLFE